MKLKVVHQEGCNGEETFFRASGDVVCRCGLPYRKHPYCAQSGVPNGFSTENDYHLHVTCDGDHVKL